MDQALNLDAFLIGCKKSLFPITFGSIRANYVNILLENVGKFRFLRFMAIPLKTALYRPSTSVSKYWNKGASNKTKNMTLVFFFNDDLNNSKSHIETPICCCCLDYDLVAFQ